MRGPGVSPTLICDWGDLRASLGPWDDGNASLNKNKTGKTVHFHLAALIKVHAVLTAVCGLTFTSSPSSYFHNSFMCMLWTWENDSWHTEEGSCCFFITQPLNKRQLYLELRGYAAWRWTVWLFCFLLKVDLHWSAILMLPVSNVVLQWGQYF